jgi:hypothetical protein
MAFTREQLEEMRRQVEEDFRLDMAAIERLQQRFAVGAPPPPVISGTAISTVEQAEIEAEVSERPSLISTVAAILASAASSLTGREIMERMNDQGFPFVGDERRRLTSINISLGRLTERGQARVTRRGSGREPNRYRAVRTEPVAMERTEGMTRSSREEAAA